MKKEILLLIVSVLFVLLAVETGLRIYGWPAVYDKNDPGLMQQVCQYDELLGWRGIPNLHGGGHYDDGPYNVDSNSKGWRDKEYPFEKPPGIKRMVVLGDSFTWGFNVRVESSYPYLLGRKLGENYQVISLGMPGYSTDQELLTLFSEGLNYAPDIVVLGFFLKDVYFNGKLTFRYPKPYFIVNERNRLILENVPVPYLKSPLRTIELVNRGIYNLRIAFYNPPAHREKNIYNVFDRGYAGSKDWQITLRLLWEINNLCRSKKIKFVILVIPYECQIGNRESQVAQEILRQFGKDKDIPVVDMLPVFEKHREKRFYFLTDVHWNENGHRAAAEEIYGYLSQRENIQGPGIRN